MEQITLETLNAADRKTFMAAIGEVMELAPWVAEETFAKRPFASIAALYQAMTDAVGNAPPERRQALINGHPDLAGKAAREGNLTADSTAEQAAAGLDKLSEQELADFHRLNDAYRAKFGMPFIVCVRRHGKDSILREFERRLKNDAAAERQLKEIYQPVLDRKFKCPVHSPSCPDVPPPAWLVTTINSAELIKHASNSFLALKISYANMVSDLAERLGADIGEVVRAMGMDPRIGSSFLSAGLGFGGFCLPKDLQAFVHLAERSGVDFTMLREVEKINKKRIDHFFEKLRSALWVVRGKQVGVLGLAFKPNTDDVRFAPAIDLVNHLLGEGARIRAYDPEAMERARAILPQIEYAKTPYDAAKDAEALLIATEWDEFRKLDWDRIRDVMARPLIVDGRNLLSPREMKDKGFEYRSFGRPD